ncbi:MAG: polysaccharide deacetylase family protein [Verrucomicrobia bacterium]|nr:polysaccharide deacetylase family protein [Verrucomicrobiota bacterium]
MILTFDDGPHHVPLGTGENYTERLLETLDANSVQDHIRAVFFVQTHVGIRGATAEGQQLMVREAAAGHLVGIHTGSTDDHVDHRTRARTPAYDWNLDGALDELDGANALESDLRRATDRIKKLTGTASQLVRPTYGATNGAVLAVYRTLGLRMLLWDVDSRDALDHARGAAVIAANVRSQVRMQIRAGHTTIVILFHDILAATSTHLDDYLIAIYEAAEAEGRVAIFPGSRDELLEWLDDALGLNHELLDSKPYELAPAESN